MDPISIGVELELGSLILAVVAGLATWIHHRHSRRRLRQNERHFQQMRADQERRHQEQITASRRRGLPAESGE